MNIICVTEEHHMPAPLVYNLGECSLLITSDYGAPDAFELVASKIDETAQEGEALQHSTIILDHDETYHLYQCLHTLFHPERSGE